MVNFVYSGAATFTSEESYENFAAALDFLKVDLEVKTSRKERLVEEKKKINVNNNEIKVESAENMETSNEVKPVKHAEGEQKSLVITVASSCQADGDKKVNKGSENKFIV